MKKTQIIILLIIVLLVSINLYYTVDSEPQSEVVNPNIWHDFSDNEHWVKFNYFEIKTYMTQVSAFNPLNRGGLSYNIGVIVRYDLKNKAKAEPQIAKFKLLNYQQYLALSAAPHLAVDSTNLQLADLLVYDDGPIGKDFYESKHYPGYAMSDGSAIQFHSSFFSPKYISLTDSLGQRLLIKTNPLLIFKSWPVVTVLGLLMIIALLTLAFSGYFENFIFVAIGTIGLLVAFGYVDYLFWFSLAIFFLISIFLKVKVRSIVIKPLLFFLDNWRIWKYLLLLLVAALFAFYHNWQDSFNAVKIAIELLLAIVTLVVGWLFIWAGATSLYTVFLFLFKPEQNITKIEFSNARTNLVGGFGRKLPVFSCDIILDDKDSITEAYLNVMLYQQLINDKQIKLKHYKTDGKGNFIMY